MDQSESAHVREAQRDAALRVYVSVALLPSGSLALHVSVVRKKLSQRGLGVQHADLSAASVVLHAPEEQYPLALSNEVASARVQISCVNAEEQSALLKQHLATSPLPVHPTLLHRLLAFGSEYCDSLHVVMDEQGACDVQQGTLGVSNVLPSHLLPLLVSTPQNLVRYRSSRI